MGESQRGREGDVKNASAKQEEEGGERVASKARQGGGYLDVKDADISGEGRRREAPRQ